MMLSSSLSPHVFCLPGIFAYPTNAGAFRRSACVLLSKLVAMFAMCHGHLFSAACLPAKSEAREIVMFVFCDTVGKRHALLDSMRNGVRFNSVFFRKHRYKISLAIDYYTDSVSSVLHVLFVRYPVAILRRIRSVIVDTVNFMACGARRHIGNKITERVEPSIADKNTPAAIVFKWLGVWVIASALHALPDIIKRVGGLKRHNFNPFLVVDGSHQNVM